MTTFLTKKSPKGKMGGGVISCVHGGGVYIVNRIANRIKTTPRVAWGGGSNSKPNPNMNLPHHHTSFICSYPMSYPILSSVAMG